MSYESDAKHGYVYDDSTATYQATDQLNNQPNYQSNYPSNYQSTSQGFDPTSDSFYTNGHDAVQLTQSFGQSHNQQSEDFVPLPRSETKYGIDEPLIDPSIDSSEHPLTSRSTKTRHYWAVILVLLVFVGALIAAVVMLAIELRSEIASNKPVDTCTNEHANGRKSMVSTTHQLATDIGLRVLDEGGNAFDAAAAVQFALGVVQPQSTGIGGGLFAMLYRADRGTYLSIDGREEAPESFDETAFCYDKRTCGSWPNGNVNYCGCREKGVYDFVDRSTGAQSVAVPGVLRAIERMLREHGTRTIAQLIQPAIELAENGFPMYEEMHSRLNLNRVRMSMFSATKRLYFQNGKGIIPIGEAFTNPELAQTYRVIASQGVDSFYTGAIARDIVRAVEDSANPNTGEEGKLTMEDLERYRAVYREPIQIRYRNFTVVGMAPPSSGGLSIAMMLNHLEQFEMQSITPGSAEFYHHVIDAQDITWPDRALYMADADWFDVPNDDLVDKEYSAFRARNLTRALISARVAAGGEVPFGVPWRWESTRANSRDAHVAMDINQHKLTSTCNTAECYFSRFAAAPETNKSGTTHMTIGDRWGNVVSLTTTIEENFGSGVVVPNRGFLLNNELTDFTAEPADDNGLLYANRAQGGTEPRHTAVGKADQQSYGGKRPMSSMSPTIAYRTNDSTKKPVVALGSPGGSAIIGAVMQALVAVLDGNMCIADAIAMPRIVSQNTIARADNFFMTQPKYAATRAILTAREFEYGPLATLRPLGYVEGISMNDDGYVGAADTTRMPVAKAAGN